ncbi:MAG TPA: ArsR family transcriptional regulator [Dehalococcoidia bacterium]|nr:ArsR family transcriptional regulator [Dehalococcoidia bacterium]
MRDLVKALKALSDETRLRIMNLLLERECCVCEVMQALNISQSRASRNLNALYDAGFLKLRRQGLWALYSLDEERLGGYYWHLIRAVAKALEGNETALQDRRRLKNARRAVPSCGMRRANQNTSPIRLIRHLYRLRRQGIDFKNWRALRRSTS